MVLCCFVATTGSAFPLSNGSYNGMGRTESQIYSVMLNITSPLDKIISFDTTYTLNDGQKKNWHFLFQEVVPNQFKVLFNSFVVGTAHCEDAPKSCSYYLPASKEKLEETFLIKDDKLIRYGHKWVNNKKVNWVEEYSLIPNRRFSF